MIKRLILILFLSSGLYAAGNGKLFDKAMFESRAGDVWHVTGSCIGTLAIQRSFNLEWSEAAGIMWGIGFIKEYTDSYKKDRREDIVYNTIGILISYPLRYKKTKVILTKKEIKLSFSWNL